MARLLFRGFVCDEDSQHLADSFPKANIVPLSAIGITIGHGTPDSAVMKHAREAGRILVTGNGSDFAKEMAAATRGCTSPSDCACGTGMITIPSGTHEIRYAEITRSLRLGAEMVSWFDVFVCNLEVAIRRDGSAVVKRRSVCAHFLRDHDDCDDCRRLGIVAAIAI
jgi:hypothetical protein